MENNKEEKCGFIDWNTLSIDQMIEHLKNKYQFNSDGDTKCIFTLIEYYENSKKDVWNKKTPSVEGSYICRMDNCYIKMCFWNGKEWFDMWKDTLDGIVIEWMNIPYNKSKDIIDNDILLKAIEKWGTIHQIELIKEECIELALALQKLNRLRGDPNKKHENIIDEIADVKIMIEQAQNIFDKSLINNRIKHKMDRLNKRLKENE